MRSIIAKSAGILAVSSMVLLPVPLQAAEKTTNHNSHAHGEKSAEKSVYKGYFENSQIKSRTLADWQGDWQSVYPYLEDGTLEPVWAHKAESGDKTAEEYKAYYTTGYRTDVDRIVIDGDRITFHKGAEAATGLYEEDGYEILNYEKGNRGVRFIFKKVDGDDSAPEIIQFSDHQIAPGKAGHYHLYWGDDREALLSELTNWPTYYPSSLNGEQIVEEMTAH
ncbi:ZinT family metal-binding protein [Notoacmeibacter marinus]|uniref:ZinT family metal-binding protein n=1 Tax=Notoacmeibacter marinus TaxID=1876515 RepID=UPI000DF26AFD|nr:metal-binding protein ZinT [Notoacmeibacter marinus]